MRILLVDDESLVLDTLGPFLVRCGHQVVTRGSVAGAHGAIDEQGGDIDLLITDVCMPDMDGMHLLRSVREQYPDIDIVLITAHSQVSDVRDAIETGAAGLLRKPIRLNELRNIVNQISEARISRTKIDHLAVSLDAERSLRETVTRERMFARRLHQRIFPTDFSWLHQSDLAIRHLPQAGLGGDYMDARPYGVGKALFIIADVSGHGTSAAFGGIALKTWFSSLEPGLSPVDILARADSMLRDLFPEDYYATAFCAIYDERSRELVYSSAAHPDPVVASVADGWRVLHAEGAVLGAIDDPQRELHTTVLGEHEVLLAYSDGLADDLMPIASIHGNGCLAWIRSHPCELKGLLTCALDMATTAVPMHAFGDDISLLAMCPRPAKMADRQIAIAGKRVLHIEDDPIIAAIIGRALHVLGIQSTNCATWSAAQTAIAVAVPDLVILDLVLPDALGHVAFRELRQRLPHLPVLVVTGNDIDRAARLCLDLNPAGILTKPVDLRELDRAVITALRFDPDRDLVTFDNLGNEWFDFVISSSETAVDLLARYLQALARQPLPAEVLDDVVWCIREMAMNGIEWGNHFAPNLKVRVSTLIMSDRVMVKIADEGNGFDTHCLFDPFDAFGVAAERDRQGKRCGGFGLAMVQSKMTRVEFNQRGNVVLLVKHFSP